MWAGPGEFDAEIKNHSRLIRPGKVIVAADAPINEIIPFPDLRRKAEALFRQVLFTSMFPEYEETPPQEGVIDSRVFEVSKYESSSEIAKKNNIDDVKALIAFKRARIQSDVQ